MQLAVDVNHVLRYVNNIHLANLHLSLLCIG